MKKKIIVVALIGLGLVSIGVWNYQRNPLSFAKRISDYAVPKDASEADMPGAYGTATDKLSEVKFIYGQMSEDVAADIIASSMTLAQAFGEEEAMVMIKALYEKYGVTEKQLEEFTDMANPYDNPELAARMRQKMAARQIELQRYYKKEVDAKREDFMKRLQEIENYEEEY